MKEELTKAAHDVGFLSDDLTSAWYKAKREEDKMILNSLLSMAVKLSSEIETFRTVNHLKDE